MKTRPDKSDLGSNIKERIPRVLLLTSTLGAGHLRATQAVEAALLERSPNAIVQTLDFWSLLDAQIAQTLRQTYLWLAQERPDLYERLYQLDQHTWRDIIERHEPLPAVLVDGIEWLAASTAKDAGLESGGNTYWVDFRLLVWTFAPAQETRAAANPEPTCYWLTREQLLLRFGKVSTNDNEEVR